MFRRLFRLIRMMLPAIVVATAWAGWWLFGDGPIKVSRPDETVFPQLYISGATGLTVVEFGSPWSNPNNRQMFWRYLASGSFILPQLELNDSRIALSDDEETLIAEQPGGPIRLYDRASGRKRAELPATAPLHFAFGWDWSFSEGTKYLAYGSTDNAVVVVDIAAGQVKDRFTDLIAPVGLSTDGRVLFAVGSPDGMVLRSLEDGHDIANWHSDSADEVMHVHVGPGGRRVLLALKTSQEVLSIDPPGRQRLSPPTDTPFVFLVGRSRYAAVNGVAHHLWDIEKWPPVDISARLKVELNSSNTNECPVLVARTSKRAQYVVYSADTMDVTAQGALRSSRVYPHASRDGQWLYLKDMDRTAFDSFLSQTTGFTTDADYRTHIVSLASGRHVRTLPAIEIIHLNNEDHTAWIQSTRRDTRMGVYELWSLTPPTPPPWLWLLTAIGVVALNYNVRRAYWPAANASTKRR